VSPYTEGMNGTTQVYALLAALAGVCLAVQAGANSRFRTNLDNPLWATFFSVIGTILFAATAMLLIRPPAPTMDAVRSTQWWNWVGGPLGTLIVLAGAVLPRHLGAAAFIAFVVGGQLIAAMLLDHFALMGLDQKAMTPGKLVGAGLVVGGVV